MRRVREGYIDVPGGKVWYCDLGTGDGAPLLCLHGGPGSAHYYLEPLVALAGRRRVILYDQLGCGRSERPDNPALWTLDRFVEELVQVRAALRLDRLHLFGNSWGGILAMQYLLDRRPELQSLILCGSPASMPRWVADCEELLARQPAEVVKVIRDHETSGFITCPEYQAAILGFYREHFCRLDPWPPSLERSFAEAGQPVYATMNGPSEFTVTGNLKDWDVMDRLGEITVPTLLVGGRYDECRPSHLEEMHRRIRGSQLAIIEDASHLCFAEQPEQFTSLLNSFLARTDGGIPARPAAAVSRLAPFRTEQTSVPRPGQPRPRPSGDAGPAAG
jgi:proline iminopeptidase